MKKSIQLIVLLSAFAVWQACGSQNDTAAVEEAEMNEAKRADALATKRVLLIKARNLKAEERAAALIAKANLTPTYKDAFGNTVYIKAEVDPSYNGGSAAMLKYLQENLKYPEQARASGKEGTVFVDFVVDAKGKVREVVASEVVGDDVDTSLKEEAVRVVASMPTWNAGLQQAKAVDVSFSLPVTFELLH